MLQIGPLQVSFASTPIRSIKLKLDELSVEYLWK